MIYGNNSGQKAGDNMPEMFTVKLKSFELIDDAVML